MWKYQDSVPTDSQMEFMDMILKNTLNQEDYPNDISVPLNNETAEKDWENMVLNGITKK